jgi:hypothetical protein
MDENPYKAPQTEGTRPLIKASGGAGVFVVLVLAYLMLAGFVTIAVIFVSALIAH